MPSLSSARALRSGASRPPRVRHTISACGLIALAGIAFPGVASATGRPVLLTDQLTAQGAQVVLHVDTAGARRCALLTADPSGRTRGVRFGGRGRFALQTRVR